MALGFGVKGLGLRRCVKLGTENNISEQHHPAAAAMLDHKGAVMVEIGHSKELLITITTTTSAFA